MMGLLWRCIPAVRPRERTRFVFFLTLDLLLSLSQTFGLVAIESLILSHWGAKWLPLNFVAASIITVIGSLLYALGVDRAKNDRYYIYLNLIFAVMVLALAAIAPHQPWAFLALGCVYYLSSTVLNNHYWTFTGDFFDTLSSKRLFPIFIIGNSLGGVIGGAVISAGWLSTEALLPWWAVLMVATALLLRVSRRSLRRWGPLELEEADETSLDGIRNSMLYLRKSNLGRWMMASFFSLVTVFFISQYLYSQIFSEAYPDSEQLTHFFGTYITISNMMEILIEGWITPLLIRYLGVATTNLIHPLATMGAFLLLSFRFQVGPAILARFDRESFDNSLGQPARNLVYNALPDRFRGRLRAFFEGIVVYTGMALAGIFLTVSVGHISSRGLTYCGLAAATVYLWANYQVRSAYLKTLVSELQAGRLELADLGDQLAKFEVKRLSQLWEALTGEAGEYANPVAVRFANTLAGRKVYPQLVNTALRGHQTWLRCTCIRALGKEAWRTPQILEQAAASTEAELRLAALETLSLEPLLAPEWLPRLTADPDARVQALALSLSLDSPGSLDALRRQAAQNDPTLALPALRLLPPEAVDDLVARSVDPNPEVRSACVERLGQLHPDGHWALFLSSLDDSNPSVIVAALKSLASVGLSHDDEIARVTRLLGHGSAEVRSSAARLLAMLGDRVIPSLSSTLASEDGKTVVAALDVLSLMHNPRARDQMALQLRQRTQQIWYLNLARLIVEAPHLSEGAGESNQPGQRGDVWEFLIQTLADAARRDLKLAFEILSHIGDPKVMRSVEKVLRFANTRARADALEVLSNLGDREASHLLVLLLEDGAWEERISSLPSFIHKPTSPAEVLGWCRESPDRWLQMAAHSLQERDGDTAQKQGLMERLLVLRKVPLFAQMSLDQLESINQLLKEVQYLRGERIILEGDLGDELYILVEGGVRIVQSLGTVDEVELNRMAGVSYFGEMSILDDEPRSASVLACEDSRLLVLKGDQLKDLILQMPEISFEIFKVLTARIRTTGAKVAGAVYLRTGEVKAPARS